MGLQWALKNKQQRRKGQRRKKGKKGEINLMAADDREDTSLTGAQKWAEKL